MTGGALGWKLRRLGYLLRRVRTSLALRGWRGTLARIGQALRPPAMQGEALDLLPLDAPFAPFAVPTAAAPRVSVIIPVHGQLAHTLTCLRSIARHGAAAPFELIVVDDASPDDSAATLARIDGLRLLRNPHNLGFIGSCNAGAAAARGEFLLFLNNDTQVTAGWLDALLACFADCPDCGIAGARLVYPDGRLQEAGGLVFADGSAWNVGRFEDRDDPRFAYRREVDYVSGAALMIPRALFAELGGFDTRYAPAYYEDADLAFAVRARGRKVVYQPASLIVHDEGTSAGTDLDTGMKRFQTINQARFVAKWQAALATQPPPGMPIAQAIRHGQPHILFMDALMPDATRDAGSVQTLGLLRLLREAGWHVSFMADNRRATPQDIHHLGQLGVETLCHPWSPALPEWLHREGRNLRAILVSRYYVAAPHLPLFRRHASQARLILEVADLHFLREQRAATLAGDAALQRQAEQTRRQELATISACDVVLVTSSVEQALLQRELPSTRVILLPNMHEVRGPGPAYAARSGLLFVGGFGHPPNVDAVNWLINDIFPRVRAKRPDITLHLVGAMPEDAVTRLQGPGIVIHGRVAELSAMLDTCRIALAPLRFGAGVKGKINVAMSHGLPVVATTLAAEGMHLIDGENALLADDAANFADAILRLYADEALWMRLSSAGLENVRRYFSIERARAALLEALA